MDLYAVLDQVVVLLRQRQRVTYQTLQVHFHLNDETLAALTDELLYTHPEVHDDAERGLVWSGDTAPAAARPPAPQERPPAPTIADAERRQLTVLFCDLVA